MTIRRPRSRCPEPAGGRAPGHGHGPGTKSDRIGPDPDPLRGDGPRTRCAARAPAPLRGAGAAHTRGPRTHPGPPCNSGRRATRAIGSR